MKKEFAQEPVNKTDHVQAHTKPLRKCLVNATSAPTIRLTIQKQTSHQIVGKFANENKTTSN